MFGSRQFNLRNNPLSICDMMADMFANPQHYVEVNNQSPVERIIKMGDREQIKPSLWAMQYRTIKGKPMSFKRYPYQKAILDDMSPKIVVRKAAQLGVSEVVLTKVFWFADYNLAGNGGKIIYTFPTFNDMLTYSSARIPPIINDSTPIDDTDFGWLPEYADEPMPYIESMMVTNSAQMKKIRNTFLFLKGTMGDTQAISIDSDWNIHDEVNFSNQNVLNKFKSRIGAASSLGWEYNFSTPTIPEYGVSKMFNKSDQHIWYIKCPHCGKSYRMEYPRNIAERPREDRALLGNYMYICHHCHNEITAETRAKGFYVCESPSVKDLRGYHIDKMGNPNLSADALMQSKEGYRKEADFYNFDLGMDYSEKSTSLSLEILATMQDVQGIGKYQMVGFAKPEDDVVIGCDQGDTLWVEVSAKDRTTGKRKLIYAEKVDYKNFDDEDPFQRLPELIDRYSAKVCVIDALPNKNSSRWLKNLYAKSDKCRVYTAYYTETKDGDINVNEQQRAVNIDRTEAFKWAYNRIYNAEYAIPQDSDIIDIWKLHMCNLKKETVENENDGRIKEFFVKTGPDHFNHAHLYNEVANQILQDLQASQGKQVTVTTDNYHWRLREGFANRQNRRRRNR